MPLKTYISTNEYSTHFLLNVVSFLIYLIIFTPDKMPLIFRLSLTFPFHVYIEVKTQTRFMVLFISGSLTHLREISRHLAWHLPQVFAYYPPLIINSQHIYGNHMMTEFAFLSNRAERWKRDLATLWGNFDVCHHLNCLELPGHSPAELISVSSFKVWRNTTWPIY